MSLLFKLSVGSAPYAPGVDGDPVQGPQATDVAAALGTVRGRGPAEVFRLRYAGDPQAGREVLRLISAHLGTVRIRKLPHRTVLQALQRPEARRVALLAVTTYVSPFTCLWCNGNGGRMVEEKWKICRTCGESGKAMRFDPDLARELRVSVPVWRHIFRPQYFDALTKLREWERDAVEAVISQNSP